jgi:quinol monooxygenase YgiN
LGSALSALVDPTRAETECLNYDLHQSIDDGDGGSTSQASQRPALMRADSSEAAFYELP